MSRKRIIAVDFDDVVIRTMMPLLKHYEDRYGVVVGPEHAYGRDPTPWGVGFDEVITRVELFHQIEQPKDFQAVIGARDALLALTKTSELHVITGRSSRIAGTTKEVIDEYFPGIFRSINFTGIFDKTSITKSSICLQLGVELLIDDHLGHVMDVAECGIDTLLFGDYPWNQADVLPKRVRRVDGWGEVLEILGASDK